MNKNAIQYIYNQLIKYNVTTLRGVKLLNVISTLKSKFRLDDGLVIVHIEYTQNLRG